ncbi:MAG: hypothetical protein Q4D19_12965, partial [Lautropia sp.]|nr:hypothetical protein [Lautropia sp.]
LDGFKWRRTLPDHGSGFGVGRKKTSMSLSPESGSFGFCVLCGIEHGLISARVDAWPGTALACEYRQENGSGFSDGFCILSSRDMLGVRFRKPFFCACFGIGHDVGISLHG